MSNYVLVDTNIVLYLLSKSHRLAEAQALFAKNPNWLSDSFLIVELTNVLATFVRVKRFNDEQALSVLNQAVGLFDEHCLVTVEHPDALKIAGEFNVSAYDARYLAVARNYDLRLVTEDKRLRAAAPDLTQSLAEAIA